MSIKLLVGLGNPGAEYRATRHNAGFWLIELYARQRGVTLRMERGFSGLCAKLPEAWLLMPQTYMNHSGQAVGAMARFYKINPDEILVAHDELDLLAGAVKLKKGGGHAGHNGLKDIASSLGSPDFWRMRIGIGHPRSLGIGQEVVDFVLSAPRREEKIQIDTAIDHAINVLPQVIEGAMESAMMRLHTPI